MRIEIVAPVPPIQGGVSQHSAQLAAALRAEGHDIHVSSWAQQYPSLLRKAGVDTGLSSPAGTDFTLRWWDPLSWWRAGRAARGCDALVFPWVHPVLAVAFWTARRAASSTRSVAIVHNVTPHENVPLARGLTRLALRGVSGCVVHTRAVAAQLSALLPDARIEVVAHPANFAVEPTPAPRRPPLRLLFLGFVRPYKGLDVLLEALARLDGRVEARLTVAGEIWKPTQAQIEREISRLGLEDRVSVRPGYVPAAEVGSLLGSHHALVAPYRSATQSGLIPLAHSVGRPVIASRVGGLVEQVRSGVDGVLVRPADPGALADAIVELGTDFETLSAGALGASTSWASVAQAVVRAASESRVKSGGE